MCASSACGYVSVSLSPLWTNNKGFDALTHTCRHKLLNGQKYRGRVQKLALQDPQVQQLRSLCGRIALCSFSVEKLLRLDTGKMRCRDVPAHHRGISCGTPAQLDHGESLLMEVTGGAKLKSGLPVIMQVLDVGLVMQSTSGLDKTTNCYVSYLSHVSSWCRSRIADANVYNLISDINPGS